MAAFKLISDSAQSFPFDRCSRAKNLLKRDTRHHDCAINLSRSLGPGDQYCVYLSRDGLDICAHLYQSLLGEEDWLG